MKLPESYTREHLQAIAAQLTEAARQSWAVKYEWDYLLLNAANALDIYADSLEQKD